MQIISEVKPANLARALGSVDVNAIYQWRRNKSIPAPHWRAIVEAGFSTLDELADAAANKRDGAT